MTNERTPSRLGGLTRLRFLLGIALAVAGLGAGLSLAACSSAPTSATSASSPAVAKVDPASFLATIATPGVVVIDVRTPEEFAAGHLPGALNMNVEAADFSSLASGLDPTVTYAVYCRSGRRSALAAAELVQRGLPNVVDLAGGLSDLQAAGAAVVTS